MYRLKVSGNYFVIDDINGGEEYLRHSKGDVQYRVVKDNIGNQYIEFYSVTSKIVWFNKPVIPFDVNVLVDSTDSSFADLDAVKTYLDSKTGFNPATGDSSGGGGTEYSYESYAKNLRAYDYSFTQNVDETINSKIYDLGGGSQIVMTFSYDTEQRPVSISLSGDLPTEILQTVKNLSYGTNGLPTITYA